MNVDDQRYITIIANDNEYDHGIGDEWDNHEPGDSEQKRREEKRKESGSKTDFLSGHLCV